MEPGDFEQGLKAAAAIGDDRLQQQGQGYVVPESFTHGTSDQRVYWLRRGDGVGRAERLRHVRRERTLNRARRSRAPASFRPEGESSVPAGPGRFADLCSPALSAPVGWPELRSSISSPASRFHHADLIRSRRPGRRRLATRAARVRGRVRRVRGPVRDRVLPARPERRTGRFRAVRDAGIDASHLCRALPDARSAASVALRRRRARGRHACVPIA